MAIRKIIHIDLDAFFCSVEELENPELMDRPFAVGGKPNERGVVSSCSYAARMYGVRSAMPMVRAKRLCPELIIISPRHRLYSNISDQVMKLLHRITPLVEQISIDEAFLDVTDLPKSVETITQEIQSIVNQNLRLPCSLGGATNKLIAKIANDFGKSKTRSAHPPNTITIIPPGDEARFLAPLSVQALWGIGPKTANKLAESNVLTIGDLAALADHQFKYFFGKLGPELKRRACGIDTRAVQPLHDVKSVSQEITFIHDVKDKKILLNTLAELSTQVGRRLREMNRSGTTIRVKVRWPDFRLTSKQKTLERNTNLDEVITAVATQQFLQIWKPGLAVRLLGVGVSGINERPQQIGLWDQELKDQGRLQQAIDTINKRFGSSTLKRGKLTTNHGN
jgi:DNA polymerase-4